MIYAAILILALLLNRSCKESLLLTLVVGISVLIPMQYVTNYHIWYALCIGIEIAKIVLASSFKTRIKYPIIFLCGLMVMCHFISYFISFIEPYRIILPSLEYLEIASCALFSKPILYKLKRMIRWTHYK